MNFFKTIFISTLFFLVFIFQTISANAQVVDGELQTWNDVILKYKFNDKLSHVGDVGARYFFESHWSVFYIRPAIQWKINKDISLTGGVALFYNANSDYDNISDYRIFQAIEAVWPRIGEFSFHHRVMTEERWFDTENTTAQYKLRGRYRLGLFTPHYKLLSKEKINFSEVLIEFLDHLDGNNPLPFNNVQRYTLVFGHEFANKSALELHYQVHAVDVYSNFNIQQHIIRIRLKLNLNS